LEASRLGKLAQAGGTSTGVAEVDEARLAAHHCSARRGVMREKRKVVEAIVPARKSRAGWFGCPHVVKQLQKSSGGVWPRISSVSRSKKSGRAELTGA